MARPKLERTNKVFRFDLHSIVFAWFLEGPVYILFTDTYFQAHRYEDRGNWLAPSAEIPIRSLLTHANPLIRAKAKEMLAKDGTI